MSGHITQLGENSPLLHPCAVPPKKDAKKSPPTKLLKGVAYVLLLSEMFERTAFYSITTYAIGLTNHTRFGDSDVTEGSASVLDSVALKIFTAIGYFLPVIGGVVGDVKKRRKHILLLGCLLYLTGAGMITWGHNAHENIPAVFMYICLVLVAFGMACLKSNVPAMGAMYWLEGSASDTTREQNMDISAFFHWYVCFTNIGAFLGVFPSPWFWNVACYVAMIASLMNLVTIVVVCCIAPPLPGEDEYSGKAAIALLERLRSKICCKFCQAKRRRLHIQDDFQGLAEKNVKYLGQLMLFFGPFILFIATYLQLYSAFGQLGAGYPVKTSTVELNGATYYVIDDLTIVFLTPVFVCILLPWIDHRYQSADISYQKVVIGAGFCLLSAILGGIVGFYREETRILYLIPQFVLLGIGEIFFQSGGYEYTFRNSPDQLKGFTMGMFVSTFGIGYGIELILMLIFSKIKTHGYPWYPLTDEDISASSQQGHDGLQYYLFVTAGLTSIAIMLMYASLKELKWRRLEDAEQRGDTVEC